MVSLTDLKVELIDTDYFEARDQFVSSIRFTIVDSAGALSFVAPAHALKMFAAACSRQPTDHRDLMTKTADYDAQLANMVLAGLHVFDEHNTANELTQSAQAIARGGTESPAPFRVYNEITRRRSMEPARAGLVVINLLAKRIVQVQNSYADLQRRDRGRLRRNGRPVRALYHYELPPDWSIVP